MGCSHVSQEVTSLFKWFTCDSGRWHIRSCQGMAVVLLTRRSKPLPVCRLAVMGTWAAGPGAQRGYAARPATSWWGMVHSVHGAPGQRLLGWFPR